MMNERLTVLLNINLQAVILVLLISGIRKCLKRVPKKYLLPLWWLLAVRLLCPVLPEASFGMMPDVGSVLLNMERTWDHNGVEESADGGNTVSISESVPGEETAFILKPGEDGTGTDRGTDLENGEKGKLFGRNAQFVVAAVWAAGFLFLEAGYLIQNVRVKKAVKFAIRSECGKNVWECGEIGSPFTMGLIRPRIYIPFGLSGEDRKYILRHETMHIRHGDPILYVLITAAVCVHWWNPVVWYAAGRMRQDIEMNCDESVLQSENITGRKDYSGVLLKYASGGEEPFSALYFGKSNVEKRIRNIFRVKEPAAGVKVFLAILICFCVAQVSVLSSSAGTREGSAESKTEANTGPEYTKTGINEEEEFVQAVLSSLERRDAESFAALVRYPIEIRLDGTIRVYDSPSELSEQYDSIITEATRKNILDTDREKLFANQYGTMLGDGAVWISSFGEQGLRIYAVNIMED